MIIEPSQDIQLDDLVLYTFSGDIDYVARVIGLPGDMIEHDLETESIHRNSQLVVTAPVGDEIGFGSSPIVTIGANQLAVYVRDSPRAPVAAVIDQRDVLGTVERIYRYSDLRWRDWATIGFFTVLTIALVCLPFVHYAQHRPNGLLRLCLLGVHSIFVLIVFALIVASLVPSDPLGFGISQPIWWWIPIAVVASFDIEPLAIALVFLSIQWFRVRRHQGEVHVIP